MERRSRAHRALFLLALLLCAWLGARVSAQNAPAAAQPSYAPVIVEGRRLFEVMGTPELSAAARAERVNRRLRSLIDRGEPVLPFTEADLRPLGKGFRITLGGDPVMDVAPADAEDNLTTPRELALLWGGKLSIAVADARAARLNPVRGAGILIRNSFRDLFVATISWLPRLAGAILLLALFWLLARFMGWALCLGARRTGMDQNLRQLVRALAFYGTWTVGFVAILSTLGFQSGSLITALGVSGFVLGFAFKDILSHFLAGLLLLMGRQFRIGDQIVIHDFEGTVERIELRALHLRTYDNRLVMIPNGEVFTSAVTSNTASPHRRREFIVGIGYDQDITRARDTALRVVRGTPGVMEEPQADVLVDELAPSTVNLKVRFYVSSLRADYLKVGSEVIRRVKEAFDQEGISMPYDTQTLTIANLPELAEALRGDGSAAREERKAA